MRKLLITGEEGFVGQHILRMKDVLRNEFGWDLYVAKQPYDLRDASSLASLLSEVTPQGVIHLAGISFVPDSIRDPIGTLQINTLGTLNLLQSLKIAGFSGSFLYVSSGDVYGRLSPEELPVKETQTPRPLNPYAASKIATEALCYQWSQAQAFERIVVARPFNHVGVGQRDDFVISSMARQIVRIRKVKQPPVIRTGDIDVTRDFLDVIDVIRAYLSLLERGVNSEIYNVCSGHERSIRAAIQAMLAAAGVQAELEPDPERFRPADQRRSVGDNQKLTEVTSWQPIMPFELTLKNILEDWELRDQ